jgi:hypothetical protein
MEMPLPVYRSTAGLLFCGRMISKRRSDKGWIAPHLGGRLNGWLSYLFRAPSAVAPARSAPINTAAPTTTGPTDSGKDHAADHRDQDHPRFAFDQRGLRRADDTLQRWEATGGWLRSSALDRFPGAGCKAVR